MLDAPVSGGPAGAASRKLAIWVGGDENVFDQHKAVLDAIGDKAAYIGPIGSATVAKLVHNMSGYAIVCVLAETFTMGVKAGIEPLALWQAVRQGAAGRRYTFDALIDQFLPGKYDPPAFALRLAHKDVSLANALGRELGVPMRMCNLTLAEMTEALGAWMGRPQFALGDAAPAGTRWCRDCCGFREVERSTRACHPRLPLKTASIKRGCQCCSPAPTR